MWRNNHLFQALSAVAFLTVIVKIVGFLKQMVTASAFGTSIETDIIALAQGLVSNIDFFITQALSTALISIYVTAGDDDLRKKKLVGDICKVFIPVSALIAMAFAICANPLARLIAPFYESEELLKLSTLLKVISPILVLQIVISIFLSILNANKRFLWFQFTGFNQSAITITLVMLLGESKGAEILVIAFGCGVLFNAIFTGIPSAEYISISCASPLKNPMIKDVLRMMFPLLLGYGMICVNQTVDKMVSSGLEEGAITALSYGAVLLNFVLTLMSSVLSVLFVHIASKIAETNEETAFSFSIEVVLILVFVFLPISILAVFCSKDIVACAFGRGAFDEKAIELTSFALMGYGFSIVPYAVRELFARFMYGCHDSTRPMRNSTIAICANIIASIVLSRFLGVLGIALGSSFADFVCAVLNVRDACKGRASNVFTPIISGIPYFICIIISCVLVIGTGQYVLLSWNSFSRLSVIAIASVTISWLIAKPILISAVRYIKHTE